MMGKGLLEENLGYAWGTEAWCPPHAAPHALGVGKHPKLTAEWDSRSVAMVGVSGQGPSPGQSLYLEGNSGQGGWHQGPVTSGMSERAGDRAQRLWGPAGGRALGGGPWAPPSAAGPLSSSPDRDIYNSQLCGPGPN